jgi:tetratricopeptide (TPR) repeat protein
MDIALQIRQNAEEQQKLAKELLSWEQEMNTKKVNPTPQYQAPPRQAQERIRSSDYNKWEKFNVDQALSDIDYQVQPQKPSVQVNPEEALVFKEKGNLYFKKQKYQKAIQSYTESIALHQTSVAFINRAVCHLKLAEQLAQSTKDSAKNGNLTNQSTKESVKSIAGYEEAIKDCESAIVLEPKSVKAYWRKGMALKELGKLDKALKVLVTHPGF